MEGKGSPPARPAGVARPVFEDDYWRSVQDLFTRDVTPKGFVQLFRYDTQETLRFFMRGVDLERLASLPWILRYPWAIWSLFLAMAHRLSPPRRLMFTVGTLTLGITWLRYLLGWASPWSVPGLLTWNGWLLLSASLLFSLLLLELRDKLTLRRDLEVAHQIQSGLVPAERFHKAGYAVHASMRPADTVGGDYYDIIELGNGGIAIAVGDVAGKGMPAALLMATLQGSLHTLISAGVRGADLIAKLNGHLHASIPSNRLVTFFYAELPVDGSTLRYINAGHNPPLVLRRQGGVEKLGATATALGLFPDTAFTAGELALDPGDLVFLYTDGVTEAVDSKDQEYGEDRLIGFLSSFDHLGEQPFVDSLQSDVLAFCGAVRPRDDMTLMLVSRDA